VMSGTPESGDDLAPPDERFWVKYSPHHELPVSSASSVALHVLVIGLILLIAYVLGTVRHEASQPPQLDAVEIEGAAGLGGDSTGAGTGGSTDGERTELAKNASPQDRNDVPPPKATLKLPDDSPKTPLDVPKTTETSEPFEGAVLSQLDEVQKAARDDFERQTRPIPTRT